MDSLLNPNGLNPTLLSLGSLLLNQNFSNDLNLENFLKNIASTMPISTNSTTSTTTNTTSNNNNNIKSHDTSDKASSQYTDLDNLDDDSEYDYIHNGSNNNHNSSTDSLKRCATFNRIFVSYPRDATEYELRSAFKRFGIIEDIHIVKEKRTKLEKGIAFIKYSKPSEAAKAYEEMNGKCLNKNYDWILRIYVSPLTNDPSVETLKRIDFYDRMHRLFIIVDKNWEANDVKNEFKKYGEITDIEILFDKNTLKNKGSAIVTFAKSSQAALALEQCHNKFLPRFARSKKFSKNNLSSENETDFDINSDENDSETKAQIDLRDKLKSLGGDKKFSVENFRIQVDNSKHCRGSKTSSSPDRKILILDEKKASKFSNLDHKIKIKNDLAKVENNDDEKNNPVILEITSNASERFLHKIFDLIPGLIDFRHRNSRSRSSYLAKYESESIASYVIKKLDRFEVPGGDKIFVDYYDQEKDQSNELNGENFIKKLINKSSNSSSSNRSSNHNNQNSSSNNKTKNDITNSSINKSNSNSLLTNNDHTDLSNKLQQDQLQQALAILLMSNTLNQNMNDKNIFTSPLNIPQYNQLLEFKNEADSTVSSSYTEPSKTPSSTTLSVNNENLIHVVISCRNEIEKELFKKIVKHFNNLIDVEMSDDKKTGYATFSSEMDALLAVNTLNEREIAGNYFKAHIEKNKTAGTHTQQAQQRESENKKKYFSNRRDRESSQSSSYSRTGRDSDTSHSKSSYRSNDYERSDNERKKLRRSANDESYSRKF